MKRSNSQPTPIQKLASLLAVALLLALTLSVPTFAGQPSNHPQVVQAGLDPSEIPIAVKIIVGGAGGGIILWKLFADGHVEKENFDKDK